MHPAQAHGDDVPVAPDGHHIGTLILSFSLWEKGPLACGIDNADF